MKRFAATGLILVLLCTSLLGQVKSNLSKGEIWKKIAPYFTPPDQFADEFGTYRSPLKFYNGTSVKTKKDWVNRRTEILSRWNSLMGEWPDLMKDQKLEILDTVNKEGFTQHRVRYKWTPNEETTGYLCVPSGKGKKPAVIVPFYEPESAIGLGGKDRDFALGLTRRGFITLSIGTTEASKNRTFSIYYPSLNHAAVQPLSMLAYAAANSWHVLANFPEVDSSRIGIMGHSFGGKWAMFASALYDKFACAVWSDPGIVFDESRPNVNYWEPWYLGYHPQPWRKRGVINGDNPARGLYPELVSQGFDLHELHALMAPRPFLVSAGSEDPISRWVPLNHSISVNKLLGVKNRVAMTNRSEHSPNPNSNEQAFLFLEYFLK